MAQKRRGLAVVDHEKENRGKNPFSEFKALGFLVSPYEGSKRRKKSIRGPGSRRNELNPRQGKEKKKKPEEGVTILRPSFRKSIRPEVSNENFREGEGEEIKVHDDDLP